MSALKVGVYELEPSPFRGKKIFICARRMALC